MRYYYDSTSNDAALLLSEKLKYIIKTSKDSNQETIILCVGSDRSTGDSLGPIIGYKLKKSMQCNFYVYGDLTHPVHAANLARYMECINQTFINPYIIAIDASLGRKDHVGLITLGTGPLRPGLGVKKSCLKWEISTSLELLMNPVMKTTPHSRQPVCTLLCRLLMLSPMLSECYSKTPSSAGSYILLLPALLLYMCRPS